MKKIIFILIVFLFLTASMLTAQPYRVVVGEIPGATDNNVKMMNAIADVMKVKMDIEVVPIGRMVYLVSSGQADFATPTIITPDRSKWAKLDYDFSETTIIKLALVLYTNKSKPVDLNLVRKNNAKNIHIETAIPSIDYIDFKVFPSTNPVASLQKVNNGIIDGYILASGSADPIVKQMNLKNIRRQLFLEVDTGWVLPKGTRGGKVDKLLAQGVAKLKKSGLFYEIFAGQEETESSYDNWQP